MMINEDCTRDFDIGANEQGTGLIINHRKRLCSTISRKRDFCMVTSKWILSTTIQWLLLDHYIMTTEWAPHNGCCVTTTKWMITTQ